MSQAKAYFVAQVPRLLDVRNLCLTLSGVQALVSFNLSMDRGDIVAIVGPSGSGKTVLLDILSGLRPPTSGILQINRRSIVGKSPVDIVRAGVVRCFQQPRLFWSRTALDNVLVGLHRHVRTTLLGTLLRTPGSHRAHAQATQRALDLLAAFDLSDLANTLAADLDLRQRKRLEIARALATDPAILLIDEPAAGMDATQRSHLPDLIRFIRAQFNVGICFADDAPDTALRCADHIIVLDHGHTLATAPPPEIRQDPQAMSAFGREPEDE